MCQEMSQYKPAVVDVTASTEDQMYQWIAVIRTEDTSATTAGDANDIRAVFAIDHLATL